MLLEALSQPRHALPLELVDLIATEPIERSRHDVDAMLAAYRASRADGRSMPERVIADLVDDAGEGSLAADLTAPKDADADAEGGR
jgi:hypothetical protein